MDTAMMRNDALSLIESYAEFTRLRERLRALRRRLNEARSYLATPGSNQLLGRAQVERLRDRHSAAMTALCAARREAHRRLGLTEERRSEPALLAG